MSRPNNPVFVAIDTPETGRAVELAARIRGDAGGIKLGKEFFTARGPHGVRAVLDAADLPLFLDLKFHDIPNTVAGAVSATLALKPFMVNVHATGGATMMQAAAEAARAAGDARPLVLAVTVLTSMGADDLADVGVSGAVEEQVVRLAKLAQASGLDGVVCSAKEITAIRAACGANFKLVTPGIRPDWATADDQKRIVTPKDAIDMGTDYLVIGRPITGADDPGLAVRKITAEIAGTAT